MSFDYSSDEEDFFGQYFKNESILLQKAIEEEDNKTRKNNLKHKDWSLDISQEWIMIENKQLSPIKINPTPAKIFLNKNEQPTTILSSNEIVDLFKSELITIETKTPTECKLYLNKSDNKELEYKINMDQLLDLNELSKTESNGSNEDYTKTTKISNNKLKGRLTKLNARRKRNKKDKIERKLLANSLNSKEKRELFKDRFFAQLITTNLTKWKKNCLITLQFLPDIANDIYFTIWNPSLDNLDKLFRKMNRYRYLNYDGESIIFTRHLRLSVDDLKIYNNLTSELRFKVHKFIDFHNNTLASIWKHLKSSYNDKNWTKKEYTVINEYPYCMHCI